MDKNEYGSFVKYLSSKKSIDDRSLNHSVWNAMLDNLKQITHSRVIEIGSGTGTMLTRLLNTGLPHLVAYDAIDMDTELISESKETLKKWAFENNAVYQNNILGFGGHDIELNFVTSEIDNFLERNGNNKRYDLLVASAFFDLVNIHEILPKLFRIVKGGGMFYFSINYDGRTDLEPVIDQELDARIIELYHKTMDQRTIRGITCCTRYSGLSLLREIVNNNGTIIEAGSSDWFVFPFRNTYRFNEAYFLHFIINTIKNALYDEPSLSRGILDEWINKRHLQVDQGELILITHQIDIFGQINP